MRTPRIKSRSVLRSRWVWVAGPLVMAIVVAGVVVLLRPDPGCQGFEFNPAFEDARLRTGPPGTVVFSARIGECVASGVTPFVILSDRTVVVSYLGVVAGFDRATGRIRWQHEFDSKRTLVLWSTPSGILGIPRPPHSEPALAHVWDPVTGRRLRTSRVLADPPPTVVRDTLITGSPNDGYQAYDVGTGQPTWSMPWGDLAFTSGERPVGYYAGDAGIRRMAPNGRKLPPLRSKPARRIRAVTTATSEVVVGITGDDSALAISTDDGRELWTVPAQANERIALIEGNSRVVDHIVVNPPRTTPGALVGRDITTGEKLWEKPGRGTEEFLGHLPLTNTPGRDSGLDYWDLRTGQFEPLYRPRDALAMMVGQFGASGFGSRDLTGTGLMPKMLCRGLQPGEPDDPCDTAELALIKIPETADTPESRSPGDGG